MRDDGRDTLFIAAVMSGLLAVVFLTQAKQLYRAGDSFDSYGCLTIGIVCLTLMSIAWHKCFKRN